MQASVRAVETRDVPTAGAATAPTGPTGPAQAATAPRRIPQRAIELVGLALGIGFIAAVALGHELSNDEFWQLAAGQWMLSHHAVIGLDPFSYTETHRRWVTDEWGSELTLAVLFRAFGNAAYAVYAIGLGGLCLWASTAYARALGARGGRVAAIVLLLAVGIAGVVASDRGLDFSLVWFPLELLVLTKARANPRWLFVLPLLCVAWVNTHGSILLGLFVLGVELGWSLVPARALERIGGVGQSRHTGSLALALLGSAIASCLTPYGPGLLAYDASVARNTQIAQYINEWNSPDFHSPMVVLVYCVPLARARRVPAHPSPPGARGIAGGRPLRRGTAVAARGHLPHGGRRGAGGAAPGPPALGGDGPPLGRGRPGGVCDRYSRRSLGTSRHRVADGAGAGVRRLELASGPDLHRVHVGRLLDRPPPGHVRRTGARTSSRVTCSPSSSPSPM